MSATPTATSPMLTPVGTAESPSALRINNPMPHTLPEGENATPLEVIGSTASDKLVIVMVGLPATGKTHIAKRICRFLSFFHDIPAQIFNVGEYRRQLCGAQQPADFYNPNNPDGQAARRLACDAALDDLVEYMRQDGVRVAALDATNSTKERRQYINEVLERRGIRGSKRMFVESICDQDELLEENIRKVKLSTPDYRGMDPEEAVADFKARRANYMTVYQPVDDSDGPHVKIINSRQFIVNNIRGYLPLKVVHFVMNLHTLPRTFYLTRHGQSEYNLLGKIGGDSGLTPAGLEYARRLATFAKEYIGVYPPEGPIPTPPIVKSTNTNESVEGTPSNSDAAAATAEKSNSNDETNKSKEEEEEKKESVTHDDKDGIEDDGEEPPVVRPCRLWTSTLRRTKETAQFIEHPRLQHTWDNGDVGEWVQFRSRERRNLDELYAGICDGMTYRDIEEVYPVEFERRQDDKLAYRYPRGESYMDVTLRLEPLAQEMERIREPVLIVAHQGILRILYAYFMGMDRKEAPYVSIPLNSVIELSPHAYGCHEKRFCLMMKEEMIDDGQDEPVTSMPVRRSNDHASANGTDPILMMSSSSLRRTSATTEQNYSPTDPIMNAPSC